MDVNEPTEKDHYDAAYQGAQGAFSEDAALHLAGSKARLLPCETFEDVFAAVESGSARSGVVPIENTLFGSIHACYDLLAERGLSIIGETVRYISHSLIAAPGVMFADVRKALSHPVALAQCEGFFRRNPQIEPVSVYDTAGAVESVVKGGMENAAAIASHRAALVHGGIVLAEAIQDHKENYTRFLQVARPADPRAPNQDSLTCYKTTIVIKLPNTPGSLFKSLRPFAERKIDLAKIESRPLRGSPFEYLFYLDLLGSTREEKVREALDELRNRALSMRVLGSYPRMCLPIAAALRENW